MQASSIFIFGGQGYLKGVDGTVGSTYPVLSVVEEYSETVMVAVSGAPFILDRSLWLSSFAVVVMPFLV